MQVFNLCENVHESLFIDENVHESLVIDEHVHESFVIGQFVIAKSHLISRLISYFIDYNFSLW